jgi:hypothetical protein
MEGRVTNWGRVKALGYAYSISRLVGEQGAVDPDYAPNTAGAIGVGIVPGGYHFIAHGTAAEHCKLFVDAMGDPRGKIVMLDVENPNAHPKPTEADVGAWFNEYRKHVPDHTVVVYSRENYWFGIGDPKLGPNVVLMTSRYPGSSTYPGDGAYAWTERWGGLSPRFWQWKGSSAIGVGASVDFSAFKGTLAELQAIAGTNPLAPDTSTGGITVPIIPQALAHIVLTADTHLYTDPDLGSQLPSTLPKGKRLRKFGGLPGWQFVQVTYGTPAIPQYAWVPSDHVDADPEPLTLVDGTPAVADCTAVQHQLDTANARIRQGVTALGGTI